MIYRLQDIFIDLFRPWIPIMGKLSEKIKYRVITLCFIVDLVLVLYRPVRTSQRKLFLQYDLRYPFDACDCCIFS